MSTCLQKWQSNTRAMPREELKRVHGPVAAGNRRERFQKSVSYIYIKSENWEINLPKNKEETIVPISLFDE